jgi:phosphoglycolate phosphatase
MGQAEAAGMSHPAIRGVLFDKDGTLFDFQKSWAPINLAAGRHGAAGDEALRVRLLTIGGVDQVTGYAAADGLFAAGNASEIAEAWIVAGSPFAQDALTAALDRIFLDGAGSMVPAADLPALFGRLKAHGLKLGVASSDSAAAVREAAERFGFAPFLDFSCGYDSGFGHKPSEGMPLAFCRTVGLRPGDVAVVGDNAHDMEMGRRAGVALKVGVLTGTGSRQTLKAHADAVIAGIAELEALLGFSRG